MPRKALPAYVTQLAVIHALGGSRRRVRRLLREAGVTVVPPGRRYRLVSSRLLRVHLPDVYDALLAGSPPAGA